MDWGDNPRHFLWVRSHSREQPPHTHTHTHTHIQVFGTCGGLILCACGKKCIKFVRKTPVCLKARVPVFCPTSTAGPIPAGLGHLHRHCAARLIFAAKGPGYWRILRQVDLSEMSYTQNNELRTFALAGRVTCDSFYLCSPFL